MKFDVEAVENIISSSPRKNGRFNLFFKLNDKIGIKLSTTIEQRDENYSNQEIAAGYELGPEVYGKIDNVQYEGESYYGYFTEIVWVITNTRFTPWDIKKMFMMTFREEFKKLRSDLEKCCHFNFCDDHMGNVGVKDGRIVCIDFDNLEEEDDRSVGYDPVY